MKIVYDYQIFSAQEYGGISRYIFEIATRISKQVGFNVTILALAHINSYLMDCDSTAVVGIKIPKIPKTARIRFGINAEICKWWLSKKQPDIVHETYYARKRMVPKECKIVITVHDMIHEKFSSMFPAHDTTSLIKSLAIRRADHVICVSENTKKDLIEILSIKPEKISVVYHGYTVKQNNFQTSDPLSAEPYILYVGQRGLYKNFEGLLNAYVSSSKISKNFKLVCFGGGRFSRKELEQFHQIGIKESQVIQISGDDNILTNLYSNASVLVYPSLYEGFGLPPLEAMSFQCPVACSNNSSLPEVVGNAAAQFDPYNSDSIADVIEQVVFSAEITRTLKKLGLERLKHFSWDICAKQTSDIYLSLCN